MYVEPRTTHIVYIMSNLYNIPVFTNDSSSRRGFEELVQIKRNVTLFKIVLIALQLSNPPKGALG